MNRNQTIAAIILAESASRPCPQIVPVSSLLFDNGKYYRPGGSPLGVNSVKPTVRRIDCYAYTDGSCTYGLPFKSEDEARQSWEETQLLRSANFTTDLEAMTDNELISQANYWLKRS